MEPALMSPTLYARQRLRGALRRWYCGRRFGHFRTGDWGGYGCCARCQARLP